MVTRMPRWLVALGITLLLVMALTATYFITLGYPKHCLGLNGRGPQPTSFTLWAGECFPQ